MLKGKLLIRAHNKTVIRTASFTSFVNQFLGFIGVNRPVLEGTLHYGWNAWKSLQTININGVIAPVFTGLKVTPLSMCISLEKLIRSN